MSRCHKLQHHFHCPCLWYAWEIFLSDINVYRGREESETRSSKCLRQCLQRKIKYRWLFRNKKPKVGLKFEYGSCNLSSNRPCGLSRKVNGLCLQKNCITKEVWSQKWVLKKYLQQMIWHPILMCYARKLVSCPAQGVSWQEMVWWTKVKFVGLIPQKWLLITDLAISFVSVNEIARSVIIM